jgi:hypothetical protein
MYIEWVSKLFFLSIMPIFITSTAKAKLFFCSSNHQNMDYSIQDIKKAIAPLNDQLLGHPLYAQVQSLEDLQLFMEAHIFAVWDFMSLLKTLQTQLTCTTAPWVPVGNADTRYLINEIVLGEESDVDEEGIRTSHFELYIKAMNQVGANTQLVNSFLSDLKSGKSVNEALAMNNVPEYLQQFVKTTFGFVNSGKAHIVAAVFTFGREDVIPEMFIRLVADIENRVPGSISTFKYYLERHIEVDGDHHSHLALEMTSLLCGSNPDFWEEAIEASKEAIASRIALWDGIYAQLLAKQ